MQNALRKNLHRSPFNDFNGTDLFHDRFFFLQSSCDGNHCTLVIDEYDNTIPQEKRFLKSHRFSGKTLAECVSAFEKAPIFHGQTLYEAENAIEVLFG